MFVRFLKKLCILLLERGWVSKGKNLKLFKRYNKITFINLFYSSTFIYQKEHKLDNPLRKRVFEISLFHFPILNDIILDSFLKIKNYEKSSKKEGNCIYEK